MFSILWVSLLFEVTNCNFDLVGDNSPSVESIVDALRSVKLRALYVPPSILSIMFLLCLTRTFEACHSGWLVNKLVYSILHAGEFEYFRSCVNGFFEVSGSRGWKDWMSWAVQLQWTRTLDCYLQSWLVNLFPQHGWFVVVVGDGRLVLIWRYWYLQCQGDKSEGS